MYSTIAIVRNIIYAAAARGGNLHKLCESAGLNLADLNEIDKRVEGINSIVNLWDEVIQSTGDEFFGLHLGQSNTTTHLGLLGYLMQHCPKLIDVFITLQKHQEKISGWVTYDLKKTHDEVILIYSIDPIWLNISPNTARHALDVAMSGTVTFTKTLSNKRIIPVRVELASKRPGSALEYEKIYHTNVTFECPYNHLVFKKEDLNAPVISYDESLFLLFNRLLDAQESQSDRKPVFTSQVKKVLVREFKGKVPPLNVVASYLNISERSFQRKLQLEGYTYRSLTTEVKKELAMNLLENSNAKVNDISEVLGYAEPSAFRKAFRTWTNTTPIQAKKEKIAK